MKNEIPELKDNMTRAEIVAWYAAAEKFVNDLAAKTKAKEKAKKAQQIRARG